MYYHVEGKPYGPRHYPLQYKEEFAFIRGMDDDLYKKVTPSITLLPNIGFNPNTAGDDVLMAYLDINKDTLETLKAYLAKQPITSNVELFTVTGRTVQEGLGGNNFYPSRAYEITISVGRPEPVYTIRAGVEMRLSAKQPYSVLYWQQG
jgi:general secretion pathway protein K